MSLAFHLFLPQMRMTHDAIVERARAAEASGFEGIAFMDHLAPPLALDQDMWEAMSIASWVLANTSALTVGHLVLCDALRHPAVLARQATSLDHASAGRFELGLGWGSVPAELETFGIGRHVDPNVRAVWPSRWRSCEDCGPAKRSTTTVITSVVRRHAAAGAHQADPDHDRWCRHEDARARPRLRRLVERARARAPALDELRADAGDGTRFGATDGCPRAVRSRARADSDRADASPLRRHRARRPTSSSAPQSSLAEHFGQLQGRGSSALHLVRRLRAGGDAAPIRRCDLVGRVEVVTSPVHTICGARARQLTGLAKPVVASRRMPVRLRASSLANTTGCSSCNRARPLGVCDRESDELLDRADARGPLAAMRSAISTAVGECLVPGHDALTRPSS